MKWKKVRVQIIFVIFVLAAWQLAYELEIFPKLMFPSLIDIFKACIDAFAKNEFFNMILYSLTLLLKGLSAGIVMALLLSSLSILSRTVYSIYAMLISVFDLIPGVALLPLAILWFGIGEGPVIFIVIHSILWPMSRSIIDGFNAVPKIYVECGRNMGLKGMQLIVDIYFPAALPSVISGLRTGWARAWRGLISTEMIFGTTSSGAGIGWYIFMRRTNVDIAGVFAALIVIILIGIVVEYGVFHVIEKNTIKKWGVVR